MSCFYLYTFSIYIYIYILFFNKFDTIVHYFCLIMEKFTSINFLPYAIFFTRLVSCNNISLYLSIFLNKICISYITAIHFCITVSHFCITASHFCITARQVLYYSETIFVLQLDNFCIIVRQYLYYSETIFVL